MVPQASQHDQCHRNTSNCSLQYFTIWWFKHSVYFFTLLCPRFVLLTLCNENLYTGKITESSMKLHLVHFQLHISFRNSLLMFYAEDGGKSTQYIKCTWEREREREKIFGTICFRGTVWLNSGLGRPYPALNYHKYVGNLMFSCNFIQWIFICIPFFFSYTRNNTPV